MTAVEGITVIDEFDEHVVGAETLDEAADFGGGIRKACARGSGVDESLTH